MIASDGVRFLANQASSKISVRLFVNNVSVANVSVSKEMEVVVDALKEGILLIEVEVAHTCQDGSVHLMRFRQSFNVLQEMASGQSVGVLKGGL